MTAETKTDGLRLTKRQTATLDQVLRMTVVQMAFEGVRLSQRADGTLIVTSDNFPDEFQIAPDGDVRDVLR